jgi:hypothetical protein
MHTVGTTDAYVYPKLYTLDLETNILKQVYSGEGDTLLQTMTAVHLNTIEDSVFTYNNKTQIFNIACIGYSPIKEGMFFTTINIANYGDQYELKNFQIITPT